MNKSTAATRPTSARHLVLCIRRPAHSRNVVTSTMAQEGSAAGCLAGGPAACRGAGTEPVRVAGTAPGLVPSGASLGGGPWRAGTRGGRPADPGGGPALSWLFSDGLVSGGLVSGWLVPASAGSPSAGSPSAGPLSAGP